VTSTNDRFVRVYEELVEEVNRRAGAASSHSFEIELASSRDGAVKKQQMLLRHVRDVRHTLQHPKQRSLGSAVLISDAFLEEVSGVLTRLRNPPTASSIGVPRRQIRTANLNDQLGDLADEMRRGRFSHIPILNESDVVIGVFNEAAVFDHLWANTETIIGRSMLISDIIRHCRLDANHTETFKFVSPRTSIDQLVEMFSSIESASTRIGAAFVTASGKSKDALQRLITPWDVIATSVE